MLSRLQASTLGEGRGLSLVASPLPLAMIITSVQRASIVPVWLRCWAAAGEHPTSKLTTSGEGAGLGLRLPEHVCARWGPPLPMEQVLTTSPLRSILGSPTRTSKILGKHMGPIVAPGGRRTQKRTREFQKRKTRGITCHEANIPRPPNLSSGRM